MKGAHFQALEELQFFTDVHIFLFMFVWVRPSIAAASRVIEEGPSPLVEGRWGYRRGGKGSHLVARRSNPWYAQPNPLLVCSPTFALLCAATPKGTSLRNEQ